MPDGATSLLKRTRVSGEPLLTASLEVRFIAVTQNIDTDKPIRWLGFCCTSWPHLTITPKPPLPAQGRPQVALMLVPSEACGLTKYLSPPRARPHRTSHKPQSGGRRTPFLNFPIPPAQRPACWQADTGLDQ